MDPDQFAEAAFGESARSIQFSMEDVVAAREMLETLLGKEEVARKEFIFSNINFSILED